VDRNQQMNETHCVCVRTSEGEWSKALPLVLSNGQRVSRWQKPPQQRGGDCDVGLTDQHLVERRTVVARIRCKYSAPLWQPNRLQDSNCEPCDLKVVPARFECKPIQIQSQYSTMNTSSNFRQPLSLD
jgi:hypothetical protein